MRQTLQTLQAHIDRQTAGLAERVVQSLDHDWRFHQGEAKGAEQAGLMNGDLDCRDSFRASATALRGGHCQAVVCAMNTAGELGVTVMVDGLPPARLKLLTGVTAESERENRT